MHNYTVHFQTQQCAMPIHDDDGDPENKKIMVDMWEQNRWKQARYSLTYCLTATVLLSRGSEFS